MGKIRKFSELGKFHVISVTSVINPKLAKLHRNWESFGEFNGGEVKTPTGVSIYPKEIFKASERWLKKRYSNLKYYNVLDSGGHFAALEKPELYIQEIRNFFGSL